MCLVHAYLSKLLSTISGSRVSDTLSQLSLGYNEWNIAGINIHTFYFCDILPSVMTAHMAPYCLMGTCIFSSSNTYIHPCCYYHLIVTLLFRLQD